MKEMQNYTPEQALRFATFLKCFNELPMLTVAVVQGPCYGGGVGLLAVLLIGVAF